MNRKKQPHTADPARRWVAPVVVLAVAVATVIFVVARRPEPSRPGIRLADPAASDVAANAPAAVPLPADPDTGAAAPAKDEKPQPNTPVEWNGDYRRFFPLAPGNGWRYVGKNTRDGGQPFEYIWHIAQRTARPGGGTLYLVELYRNGEYRDRFFFGSDATGIYRFSTPDAPPGPVLKYPAEPGTSWPIGAEQARVVAITEVTTPAGRFANAVQVCTQEKGKRGDPFWTAAYEYFVPGVGRVKSETLSHHDGKTDTLKAELAGFAVRSD